MQVYRIKLGEVHEAEAYQVNKQGYLSDESGKPFLYGPKGVQKRAEHFGGKPEKFGKKYTTSRVSTIQFDEISFEPQTLELLKENVAYSHSAGIGHFFCYTAVFDELLERYFIPENVKDELKALAYICRNYDYVQILKH